MYIVLNSYLIRLEGMNQIVEDSENQEQRNWYFKWLGFIIGNKIITG